MLEGGEGTSRNDAHACVLRKVAKKKKKLKKSSARSSVSHGHFALHNPALGADHPSAVHVGRAAGVARRLPGRHGAVVFA